MPRDRMPLVGPVRGIQSALVWLLMAVQVWVSGALAQSEVNVTAGTLEIGLTWNQQPWTNWQAAGSIQVVAEGVLNATVSGAVTTLNRLPVTNTVVRVFYRGGTAGDSIELAPPRLVVLLTNKTVRLDYDLTSTLSLVTGRVTLNGAAPPPLRLVSLSDAEGNPWLGARTDTNGGFRALVPSGPGTGQVALVNGQGGFSFTSKPGQTLDVGTIAITSASLRLSLSYGGRLVSDLGVAGSVALSAGELFGRIVDFSQGNVQIGNLPAQPVTIRVGYGAMAVESGSPDLIPPLHLALRPGTNPLIVVPLDASLGILTGVVEVNGALAPSGTQVALLAPDGGTLAIGATDATGRFYFLAPAGTVKGQVFLVDGQGAFSYGIIAGQTRDLGILRLGSGAVEFRLLYNGRPISELRAEAAILVRAEGILTNYLSRDVTVISNLPPASGTLRVGYGSAILATESDYLASTSEIPVTVSVGQTYTVLLDLCGPLGLVEGTVTLNGTRVPAGTLVDLGDYAGRGYLTASTDSDGVFRALVPSGPGKGQVKLIAGQGEFSFRVRACSTADLGGAIQNQIPHLDPLPPQSVVAGSELTFRVSGHDTDSPVGLVFSLEDGKPDGAVIDPATGVFRWTPPLSAGGRTFKLLVTGTDSGTPPSSDTMQVSIAVQPHAAPQVRLTSPVEGLTAVTPASLSLAASALAFDGSAISQIVFFSESGQLGVSTTAPHACRWDGVPLGVHTLLAVAVDSAGALATSAPVHVAVVLPPNHPPAFAPPGVLSQLEGRELVATLRATDPDAGQSVNYSLGDGAPAGATINATTGVLRWTPPLGPGARSQEIPIVATDTGIPPAQSTVRVTVLVLPHVSPGVQLTSPASDATAVAPGVFHLLAAATPGTDAIQRVEFYRDATSLGAASAPPYQVDWTAAEAGTYQLTARAVDLAGVATVSAPVRVKVTPPGPPPAIALAQPVAGSVAFSPAPISFAVSLTNLAAAISRVEYLSGGAVVAASDVAPFSAEWIATDAGSYSFSARVVLSSGATLVSPPVPVSVGGHRAAVVLVSAGAGPESAAMEEALGKMGRAVDVLSAAKVGPASLFGYRLAIWNDAGDSNAVVSEAVVSAFERARATGTPLYFVGERLLSAVAGQELDLRRRWYALLNASPSGLPAGSSLPVTFEAAATDHPLLHARGGLVEEFTYPGSLESADAGPGDVELVGTVKGRPVLLMSPSADSPEDSSRRNTVTQFFLLSRASGSAAGSSPEALFGNAVDWLIGTLCFSQVVRVESSVFPEAVNVGDEFTLTLLVSAHGECGATGVEIIQNLPPSWTVVGVDTTRGSVAQSAGTVGFSLGRLPLSAPETLTVRIRPTTPGIITNLAQIHWNEEPADSAQVAESVITVTGTLAPSLDLQRNPSGHLILHSSAAPDVTLQLESSATLRGWNPVQTLGGGERTVDLGVPPEGSQPLFYRTRVLP